MPRHLMLFGEQRSGTSLLVHLLETQPGVVMRTGLLWSGLQALHDQGVRDATEPLAPALARRVRDSLERASIRIGAPGLLALRSRMTGADLLCGALEAGVRGPPPAVVGSKEHAPTQMTPALLSDRRVHVALIVRDARDVILSRARRGDGALPSKALMWRRTADVALQTEHPRFTIIRFEQLVTDPVAALRPLLRSLGQELDDDALARWELPEGTRTNTMFGEAMRRVSARPAERWRQYQSDAAVQMTGWICKRQLAGLGYAEGPRLAGAVRRRVQGEETLARARYRLGAAWRRLRAERQ